MTTVVNKKQMQTQYSRSDILYIRKSESERESKKVHNHIITWFITHSVYN